MGRSCKGSIGHVARIHGTCCEDPWDMLQGLNGACCKGSMGHVAMAPWDTSQGLNETC